MSHRRNWVFAALVFALGVLPAEAQVDRVRDPNWTVPRLPDGQPDLQGKWGNKTITPIERSERESRAYLTDEEMASLNQRRADAQDAQDAAPEQRYEAGGNVGGYGSYWLDAGDTVLPTGQTSMVMEPPSGRVEIKQWALDAKAYNLANEGDHYQHMSVWDRCISRGVPGSMLPAGYNNVYRIMQTADHVAIHYEMIHDVRVIPFDKQVHVHDNITMWMGDSRDYWDGDVLVVESKNFHNRGWIASSMAGRRLKGIPTSTALHVVERFERVSEHIIMWDATVSDPNVYDSEWTISMPLTAKLDYVMFEYACHEGNYSVPNALSGERAIDRMVAEANDGQ